MSSFVNLIDQRRLIGPGGSTVGGEIFFYYTNTSVLAPIFYDVGMTVPAPNPIAVGAGDIVPVLFLDEAITYRRVIVYADGTRDEVDPLNPIGGTGGEDLGVPIGGVIDYAGTTAPEGFLLCDGRTISRTEYASLFVAIGTTYGSGDGSSTFTLPDFRGRVGAGKDNMGGVDSGRLSLFSGTILGAGTGSQTHTLITAELASHSHTITDPGHAHSGANVTTGVGDMGELTPVVQGSFTGSATTGITIDDAGGNAPHANVQPTLIVNKVIKYSTTGTISLGAVTAIAQSAWNAAGVAEDFAELSQESAELSKGFADAAALAGSAVGVYPTTTEGIDKTKDGESFYVTDGTDFALYRNNEGVADLVIPLPSQADIDSRVPYTELASTAPGDGVDLIAPVVSPEIPNPVVLRTILLDAQVSRMLSATGDGDTDPAAVTAETAKFQAMADTGRSFSVPEPSVTYAVNTINMAQGQTIEGSGQYASPLDTVGGPFQFTGNGADPVFVCGDGTGAIRQNTLRDLSVENDGADCVQVLYAPNFLMERCRARSVGGRAVYLNYSWRAAIRDNWLFGLTGIEAKDNINGLTIENNTVSGGQVGKAMDIGMCQALRIVTNIMEVSRDGIWIGSGSDVGNGNCNGVLVADNYFEEVGTPLVLGKVFTLLGLDCHANFLSNTLAANLTYRQAMIQFGRIQGGNVSANVLYPINKTLYPSADDEDLFWIWLESASGGFSDLSVVRNVTAGSGAAANVFQLKGAFAANASVKANVSGVSNFGFMGAGNPLGTDDVNEYISPVIDPTVTGTYTWLHEDRMSMGGALKSIEIIDYTGGTLTGVQLSVGRTASLTENAAANDLGALTFSGGRAVVPITGVPTLGDIDRTYRILGQVSATGEFRIKIRYRAN